MFKFESDVERIERIEKQPLRLVTEELGKDDMITECVVDYRDYLWLIEQAKYLRTDLKVEKGEKGIEDWTHRKINNTIPKSNYRRRRKLKEA